LNKEDISNKCDLDYIPSHLHWNSRPKVHQFYVNEKLYWRCKPENADNPYKAVSLVDISVNRSGTSDFFFSYPDDVLFDTSNSENERYINKIPLMLEIKRVKLYDASLIIRVEDIEDFVGIQLIHDPLKCNYAHSLFRFRFQGQTVDWNNYDKTLGKKNKTRSRLRRACKDEISKMIIREEIIFK